jgi:putative mRNA 3-end processing factor
VRARGEQVDFGWSGGVRVTGTGIWCDAPRRQQLCFVSSAREALSGARVVTTERTLELRAALDGKAAGARRDAVLVTPYARPFALGRLRVELLPSGHVPGAAQLLVERPGRRALYAGRVNPRAGRLSEPAQVRACDALALSAPLAPLLRALPEREEVEAALLAAVHAALEAGDTPVVLAPALGAAEEIAALLGAAGLALRAHPRILRLLGAYVRMGLMVRTPARALRRASGAEDDPARQDSGEVVLWPLELAGSPVLARLARGRRLLVAGEALDPAAVARARCAAGFALSDDGDLPSLLEHAHATGARDVYFTCGLTDEVARAFAVRRLRARPLGPPEQMRLFSAR